MSFLGDYDPRNSKTVTDLGNLFEFIRNAQEYSAVSLPQFTKRSTVSSRVFIQEEVLEEPALPDLFKVMQDMYIGWILTAVQMNEFVDGSRTVKDMLSVVATEQLQPHVDIFQSIENMGRPKMNAPDPNANPADREHIKSTTAGGGRVLDGPKDSVSLASGRILEITFGVGASKTPMKVNIFVQLLPTVIKANVAEQFLAVNFTPSWMQRWVQWTTGEISFFKDLIFQRDLLAKRRKALKEDKTGTLTDMLQTQNNALANAWMKMILAPERKNIANSILIFEKSAFDKFCHVNGVNFMKYDHRSRFFSKTFAMIVAVIDPLYNKVHLYFHGIEARGEYTYSQLKAQSKQEKFELVDIMRTFSQGSAPRF